LIDSLLGFAVLSGPLWLIALLLPIAIVLAIRLSKRFHNGITRSAATIVIIFAILLLPFSDGIVGRIYHSHLCATQAGIKVYQKVELPKEFWDNQGKARFIQKERSLDFDHSMLGNRYERKSELRAQSAFLRLDRDSYQLFDTVTQSVVGENVNYTYWGGWTSRNLSPNVSAISCSRQQAGYFTDVLRNVFEPTASR